MELETFNDEEFRTAVYLAEALYDVASGKGRGGEMANISLLSLCLAVATYYLANYEVESKFHSPEDFGKLIGEIVPHLIKRAKIDPSVVN